MALAVTRSPWPGGGVPGRRQRDRRGDGSAAKLGTATVCALARSLRGRENRGLSEILECNWSALASVMVIWRSARPDRG